MSPRPAEPNLLIRPSEVAPFDRGHGVATIPYVGKWNCEQNLVTTGQTVFEVGRSLPVHSHNVEESVLVLEGEATAKIGDEYFDHRFYNRGDSVMRIYWVYGGCHVTRTMTETGETFEHLSEHDKGAQAT
jgi:hypothetical protein